MNNTDAETPGAAGDELNDADRIGARQQIAHLIFRDIAGTLELWHNGGGHGRPEGERVYAATEALYLLMGALDALWGNGISPDKDHLDATIRNQERIALDERLRG